MLELIGLAGGVLELSCSWRFWIGFMMGFAVASAGSSSAAGSMMGNLGAVAVIVIGSVTGWMWNRSRTGNRIP